MFVSSRGAMTVRKNGRKAGPPPSYGRFLEPDPIGQEDNPNLYAYTHNDPVNLMDPLGLDDGTCGGNGCGPPIPIVACRDEFATIVNGVCVNDFSLPSEDEVGGGVGFFGPAIGTPEAPTTPVQPPQQQQNQCSQRVVNFANGLSNLGTELSKDGNDVLGIAAVAALAGVPITATGVGAPVGATDELTAGGIAGVGLAAKLVGGTATYFGHLITRVETGTTSSFGKDIFASVAAVVPSGGGRAADVAQDQAADAANASLGPNSPPATCP